MKNNKTLTIVAIALVVIVLIGVVAIVLKMQMDKPAKSLEPTIDDVLEASVDVEEITTNLSDKKFVRLTLKIQTTSKDAAEELGKRDFQTKNIIIKELSELSSKNLEGKDGKLKFESAIKTQLNELMRDGEITEVSITSCIIS